MNNDEMPAWVIMIIIIFAGMFLLWQAQHFKMSVLDLLLGATPVMEINNGNK